MAKLEEAIKNVSMVKNYIAGKWVEPKSDLGDIVSPANCQVIARIRNSTKDEVDAASGNVGINIGIAAPMAFFPFSGMKDSFFGVLHSQGQEAVRFFTESKVAIERWS